MEMTTEVTINKRPVAKFASNFQKKWKTEGAAGLSRGMEEILELVSREFRDKTYLAAGLKVRSGEFRRSIGRRSRPGIWSIKVSRAGRGVRVTGEIGSSLIYAGVQEHGMTIRPVFADRLVFPLLNPGGGMRIVGWRTAEEVTIPARPSLRPAIDQIGTGRKVEGVVAKRYSQAITRAGR